MLAEASKLAYRDSKRVRRVLNDVWDMQGKAFSCEDTQGFVAKSDHLVIVSVRGTKGLKDWLGNLNVSKRRFEPICGDVHGGFLSAWQDAEETIREALGDLGGRTLWLTGHSLGGAVAVIGAAALSQLDPTGVITFGQPRALDEAAASFVSDRYRGRYMRIVNDDDIVPRVPPFFRHTGHLYHFDFAGNLRAQLAPSESLDLEPVEADSDGPTPLSDEGYSELVELISQLEIEDEANESSFEFESNEQAASIEESIDVAMEGIIPGVESHRIDAYVNLVRRKAFQQDHADIGAAFSSIASRGFAYTDGFEFRPGDAIAASPFESEMFALDEGDGSAPGSPASLARQPVLLRLHNPEWDPPKGMPIGSRVGTVVTARANRSDMLALESDANVALIEVSREAGINDLTQSVPFIRAESVHRPPVLERGDACLIGVIDTGIDILHHSFRGDDGATRIIAIWDQRGSGGPTPNQVDRNAFTQDYGRLYLQQEIQQFIDHHAVGQPSHPIRLRDPSGHGTHVAAIAAGRATTQQPDGVAPDAGIVVVMSSLSRAPGDPLSIGYSNSHVDGLAFFKRVSEGGSAVLEDSRPIVINVSQGMNAGAHDGSTTLEAAFDGITGGGRIPGCVIVKSAGNERGQAGHALIKVFQGAQEVRWLSSTRLRPQDYFEAWFDGFDDIAFRLIDPQGNFSDEVSFDDPSVSAVLGGNLCHLQLTERHADNGHHRLAITIHSNPQQVQAGTWRLELNGREILSEDGQVNIWVERTRLRAVRFESHEQEMTLSIPGTARTVVCVAACNSETPVRLNASSSWGLTRDGRPKPDVSAPGNAVVSARSGQIDLEATAQSTGTSMAAPHVAGALALVMSNRAKTGKPQLNAVQLKSGLTRTVRGVPHRHHVGAGYGVLDVEKLFNELT